MNTQNDELTKKLRELNAKYEYLKKQYEDNTQLITPQKEVLYKMLTSISKPLEEKYYLLKLKLNVSMNKTKELDKTLIGKTTEADKLIRLSKEISNRFNLQ